jgi:hypothetical protein
MMRDTERTASPCPVCTKKTDVECSHVDCPNRRRLTAAPPQGANVWHLRSGVMQLPTCRE